MRIGVVGRGMESRLCDERTTDRRENSVETSREPHPCGRDDDGCQADDECVRGMLVSQNVHRDGHDDRREGRYGKGQRQPAAGVASHEPPPG